jgi:hypothetical protein
VGGQPKTPIVASIIYGGREIHWSGRRFGAVWKIRAFGGRSPAIWQEVATLCGNERAFCLTGRKDAGIYAFKMPFYHFAFYTECASWCGFTIVVMTHGWW